jgi:hypothetical protein
VRHVQRQHLGCIHVSGGSSPTVLRIDDANKRRRARFDGRAMLVGLEPSLRQRRQTQDHRDRANDTNEDEDADQENHLRFLPGMEFALTPKHLA